MMHDFLAAGMHWKFINFAIFAIGLIVLLKKPVADFWAKRTNDLKTEIEDAKRLRAEAQARHRELEARWSRIAGEVNGLAKSLKEEGEAERVKMVQDAQALSVRMKSDSEKIVEQEVRRAKEILKAQAVQLAMELADRLIRENIRLEDQQKMAEQYLIDLEKGAA